jgi:hypothetical protein
MAVTKAARMRWWPGALAWALWALGMLGLAAVPWMDRLLRQAGRADLVQLTPDTAGPATRWVGCCWPWPCPGSPPRRPRST